MTLRDLCDVAYVVHVAGLEREASAIAGGIAGVGGEQALEAAFNLCSEVRAAFDAALLAEPEPDTPSRRRLRELKREIGVA